MRRTASASGAAGQILDRTVREQINVELRPEVLDHVRKVRPSPGPPRPCRRRRSSMTGELLVQQRHVMARREVKSRHRSRPPGVDIENNRQGRILEAADLDNLIDKGSSGRRSCRIAFRALSHCEDRSGYDQDLEIGLVAGPGFGHPAEARCRAASCRQAGPMPSRPAIGPERAHGRFSGPGASRYWRPARRWLPSPSASGTGPG